MIATDAPSVKLVEDEEQTEVEPDEESKKSRIDFVRKMIVEKLRFVFFYRKKEKSGKY